MNSSRLLLLLPALAAATAEIHDAVEKGDAARVRVLLKKDQQLVHSKNFRAHATPLAVAIVSGKTDCVRALLDNGADVNEPGDDRGATPLILAATAMDDDNRMALMATTARRTAEQMPDGEARKRLFSLTEEFEKTATPGLLEKIAELPLPASPERIEILELILARKPDFKARDQEGLTVMHYAAKFSSANVIELLVARGGDVNLRSRDWRTPLHLAAEAANIQAAKVLLKNGVDVDSETSQGRSPLHFAAANGSMPLMEVLLAASARPDLEDINGASPLHLAAQSGKVEVATKLLAAGADVAALDTGGMTPLHYASSFGRLDMVGFLLKRGAKLEASDSAGFTPLLYAAEKGQMMIFEALLAAGASPKLLVKDRRTVLHLICSNSPSPEWIERLVAAGIPVDGADVNRFTPLHRAAQWGRREAVEKLLKLGANPNAVTSNRNTPLVFASSLGEDVTISPGETKGSTEDYQAICEMLVRAGARFDIVPENGWTLLHSGASMGNLELIERAFAAGVPINSKDDRGGMPLHYAAKGGFTAVVEMLLKHGADANATDQSGNTPICLAASKGPSELIELLAKNGAKINTSDPKLKATPLHMAAAFHNVDAVKALLSHGADVSARDYLGHTPLHVAASIQEIDKIRDAGPASRDFSDILKRSADPAAAIQEFKFSPLVATFKTEMESRLAYSRSTDSPARSLATTKLLLEHGASPTAKDHDGLTPLDVATRVGTPEILRLLENPPRASKK